MESRIHGDMYVRFGGRLVETYYRKVEKRCWPSLLKEISDLCGIHKEISTHTARHSYATTVCLQIILLKIKQLKSAISKRVMV